jgi:hypothetical protein
MEDGMKKLQRSVLTGGLIAALLVMMDSTVRGSVSPNPYSSSTDRGLLWMRGALGTGTCNITGISWSLLGVTGGAAGSIGSYNLNGCTGIILSARSENSVASPITVTLISGVTVVRNLSFLITTSFGDCHYRGTLSGTWTSPTSMFASGNNSFPLLSRLSGICENPVAVTFTSHSTGATITNP